MTRDRIPWKQYFMMQALVIAQRQLTEAIKRARQIALLPYVTE